MLSAANIPKKREEPQAWIYYYSSDKWTQYQTVLYIFISALSLVHLLELISSFVHLLYYTENGDWCQESQVIKVPESKFL